jgi:HNH endonuclease
MRATFGDARLPLRFWSKVLPVDGGCWIWIGAMSSSGYGSFGVRTGRGQSAHRHAYLTLVGPAGPGLDLDHLCRNRDCVNPDHLEPVTRMENVLRGDAGKHHSSKTHCPKGHAYDEKNTRWRPDCKNSRDCRACKNAAMRARRAWLRECFPKLKPLTDEQFAALDAALKEAV